MSKIDKLLEDYAESDRSGHTDIFVDAVDLAREVVRLRRVIDEICERCQEKCKHRG